MEWEIVMGLEVHVELATKTKIFCSCTTEFGGAPNTHCCPVCTGMPGTLPVLNKKVLEYAVKAGLALNCDITRYNKFDRKNYFYPDLPKAYQISQLYLPFAQNGHVDLVTRSGKEKTVRIHEIHMEEDAGKLVHSAFGEATYPDYNRCGVPLIEIVSEPDFRTSEEVIAYLEKLKTTFEYLGISDCKMQEGSMRADVNLSVRPMGAAEFGTRTEMKNINSFKAIERAIAFESARQIEALENGEKIVQETRRWDDAKGKSYAMRSKETAGDYRYFPDPNVMPVVIDDEWFNTIQASVPEFPEVKREKYIALGLTEYDAERISESIMLCECFEEASEACGNPKEVVNWITSDVMRILNAKQMTYEMLNLDSKAFGKLIALTVDGKISRANSKKILSAMFDDRTIDPESYAEANDMLIGEQNDDMILEIVKKVVESDPKSVNDFKGGKEKALMALFGKCMKELKGNCDPQQLKVILLECVNNA